MRRGWGAGEQTDRKREACRPPERKLTSGSSGVSQPQPEPAASSVRLGAPAQPLYSSGCGWHTWHWFPAVGEVSLQGCWAQLAFKDPKTFHRNRALRTVRVSVLRALCPSALEQTSPITVFLGFSLHFPFRDLSAPKALPWSAVVFRELLSTLLPPWLKGPSSSVWLRVVTAILELLSS